MLDGVARLQIDLPGRGVRLAVLDWGGAGPPAVLHHANGFCAALWDPVARALSDRFRVFALDARGHGDSSRPEGPGAYRWSEMAEDLAALGAELLRRTRASRFALAMGHSFGGTLTLAAASAHPPFADRLLCVDPVILPRAEERASGGSERSREMAERARRRRDVWESREAARAHFAARSLFADWRPEALDLYVAEGLRARPSGGVELKCPGAVEGAIFAGDQGMDIFERVAALQVPARLLRAVRGNFPRALYDRLVAPAPRAEVRDLDSGHLAVMESPERDVEAVEEFLSETGTGTASLPGAG